jgi:hypothetical protein
MWPPAEDLLRKSHSGENFTDFRSLLVARNGEAIFDAKKCRAALLTKIIRC